MCLSVYIFPCRITLLFNFSVVRQQDYFSLVVNGNFTEWTDWGSWSATCTNTTRIRTRTCTNPSPAYNGKNCDHLGVFSEVEEQDLGPCKSTFRKIGAIF